MWIQVNGLIDPGLVLWRKGIGVGIVVDIFNRVRFMSVVVWVDFV